jgi:hypothetical protein
VNGDTKARPHVKATAETGGQAGDKEVGAAVRVERSEGIGLERRPADPLTSHSDTDGRAAFPVGVQAEGSPDTLSVKAAEDLGRRSRSGEEEGESDERKGWFHHVSGDGGPALGWQ